MREFSSEPQHVKRANDKMEKGPSTDAKTLGNLWQLPYHMNFIS